MTRYSIDATIILSIQDFEIDYGGDYLDQDELRDAIVAKLESRLSLHDIKGARIGGISSIECDSVDNWVSI